MSTDTSTNTTISEDGVIDGAVTEVKAPDNALVVTNPEQYATELYEPFHVELKKAKRQAASKPYDIRTDEGLAAAEAFFVTFQKIRTRADKLKAERKKPIDQAGKALLNGFNTLAELAKAEENKHGEAIAARKKEIADEKQRKLDQERERVEALEAKVDAIRLFPSTMTGATSDQLRTTIEEWANKSLAKADYQEYFEDAVIALEATVIELRKMLDNTLKAEAAARQAELDRQELERLRAEQAEREKKAAEDKRQADEAAAEAARQLAAQQEALARSQQIMAGLMDIQQRGMLDGDALTLHKAIVELQQLDVGARHFDNMASMAAGARDMSINALTMRYQARLALELEAAHAEALDVDAEREAIAGQAARTAAAVAAEPPAAAPAPRRAWDFGMGVRTPIAAPLVAPATPAAEPVEYVRPTDAELVDVLAKHYDEEPAIVSSWLREFKG